jgi:hypothetical protein
MLETWGMIYFSWDPLFSVMTRAFAAIQKQYLTDHNGVGGRVGGERALAANAIA